MSVKLLILALLATTLFTSSFGFAQAKQPAIDGAKRKTAAPSLSRSPGAGCPRPSNIKSLKGKNQGDVYRQYPCRFYAQPKSIGKSIRPKSGARTKYIMKTRPGTQGRKIAKVVRRNIMVRTLPFIMTGLQSRVSTVRTRPFIMTGLLSNVAVVRIKSFVMTGLLTRTSVIKTRPFIMTGVGHNF